jgi:hypothetical protein
MGLLCVICAVYSEDLIYGSYKGEDVFSGRKRKKCTFRLKGFLLRYFKGTYYFVEN